MFSRTFVNCTVLNNGLEYDSITFDESVISIGGENKGNDVLDLEGALVLPGFVDSHAHLYSTALKLMTEDLDGLSRREVLVRLAEAKPSSRGWVVSRGWDESLWKKTDFLTPDEITNESPTVAIRVDGHMAILNKPGISKAREMGIPVDEDGLVNEGNLDRLQEGLRNNVGFSEQLLKAEDYCLSNGITTISDVEAPELLPGYMDMQHRMRVVFNPIGKNNMYYRTGEKIRDNLYMGHTKLFADGSIGSRTAVMSDGYRDSDASPELIYDDSKLEALYNSIVSRGDEVMTHAIGDVAVDQVIRMSKKFSHKRVKIEHNEFVLPMRNEMEERDILVSMQPNFLRWSFSGGMYERRLGSGYIGLNNRYGSLLKNGVRVAFGSDSMPIGPIYGIKLAMNPPTSGQKISFDNAIRCYTENSAYALHLENITGTLDPGKKADMVVLDKKDLSVRMTVFGGQIVFNSEKNEE